MHYVASQEDDTYAPKSVHISERCLILTNHVFSKRTVPNLFGTRDQFWGRPGPGPGLMRGRRDGFWMIRAHYIYCSLCFYHCCLSSTADHQPLDPRGWGPLLKKKKSCVKEALRLKHPNFKLTSLGRGFRYLVPQIISVKPLVCNFWLFFFQRKRSASGMYKPISEVLGWHPSRMLSSGLPLRSSLW